MSGVPLRVLGGGPPLASARFERRLAANGGELRSGTLSTLQVNLGKKCNQACRHCHVDAGPQRPEVMPDAVLEACLDALARHPALATLDVTGGAP